MKELLLLDKWLNLHVDQMYACTILISKRRPKLASEIANWYITVFKNRSVIGNPLYHSAQNFYSVKRILGAKIFQVPLFLKETMQYIIEGNLILTLL